MILKVNVEVVQDDGSPWWGYDHIEQYVPRHDDALDNETEILGKLLGRIQEAQETIMENAGADVVNRERGDDDAP